MSERKIYESPGALTFKNGHFILHDKEFKIYSGTMHYFRVHPDYWKDRLLKMKACGLNTVETYVPWNLHEEQPSQFNFNGFLDVRKFIQQAQEAGLYVIFRPGPYICAEWDLGGLPSWLLRDPCMKVRSNYKPYQVAVQRFFETLLPKVTDLQALQGGPIIAFQVENEFGSYSNEIEHLLFIKELLLRNGVQELLLTSDNIFGLQRAAFYEHALPTVNFPSMDDGRKLFDMVRQWSPEFPLMVMEFWPGWFDHWGQPHKGLSIPLFEDCLKGILEAGASFNMYMFHGGTNFGFMSGANFFENSHYKPDVTSYDYDAPLSEAGDVTDKFKRAREIIQSFSVENVLPAIPKDVPKSHYGTITVTEYLSFKHILSCVNPELIEDRQNPVSMEMLNISENCGQTFGYTLYQTKIGKIQKLQFSSLPKDRAQVFLNSIEVKHIDWFSTDLQIPINTTEDDNTLEILVENHGRVNYVECGLNMFNEERKGLEGEVSVDGSKISSWKIFPIEFKKDMLDRFRQCNGWMNSVDKIGTPALGRCSLQISEDPKDTFLQLPDWDKGIAFVNGFNLGRYWKIGPTQTLYVPAPLLKQGSNEILIFEQHSIGKDVILRDLPILGKPAQNDDDSDKACYPTQ